MKKYNKQEFILSPPMSVIGGDITVRQISSLQQGGYMTLAKFAMIFWHDLAAPILAGIITAAIVSWWRNRK